MLFINLFLLNISTSLKEYNHIRSDSQHNELKFNLQNYDWRPIQKASTNYGVSDSKDLTVLTENKVHNNSYVFDIKKIQESDLLIRN